MTISSEQATQSLEEAERTRRRALRLQGYERSAPHLFLWGIIWIVAFGLIAALPRHATSIWVPLDVIGFLGSFAISWRAAPGRARGEFAWRYVAVLLTLAAFVAATYFVMEPRDWRAFATFPVLVVATAYALLGIFRGSRLLVTGLAIAALALLGQEWLPATRAFLLWMAAVGGGALLLSGFWLRRA